MTAASQPSSVQPQPAPGQSITATAAPQFLPNQTIARAKFEPTPDGASTFRVTLPAARAQLPVADLATQPAPPADDPWTTQPLMTDTAHADA